MPITYNTVWWDKVLNPIKNIIKNEFPHFSTYISESYKPMGNISFRLFGISSTLLQRHHKSEIREYEIEIAYYLKDAGERERTYEKIYRDMDRLNTLVFKNRTYSGTGGVFFDMKMDSISIDDKDDIEETIADLFVAKSTITCKYSAVFADTTSSDPLITGGLGSLQTFYNRKSMLFDGVDEYLQSTATYDPYNSGNISPFTMSAWVKLSSDATSGQTSGAIFSHNGYQTQFAFRNTTWNGSGFDQIRIIGQTGGIGESNLGNGWNYYMSHDTNWHHIVWVAEQAVWGTNAEGVTPGTPAKYFVKNSLYVDGVQVQIQYGDGHSSAGLNRSGQTVGTYTPETQTWTGNIVFNEQSSQQLYRTTRVLRGDLSMTDALAEDVPSYYSLSSIRLGADRNTTFYPGYIDEATMWTKALSASEILSLYNSGKPTNVKQNSGDYVSKDNILFFYRMGDNAETRNLDTDSNNLIVPDDNTSSVFTTKSCQFDGVDDQINFGSNSSLDNIFDGGGSISFWIKPTQQSNTMGIIQKIYVGGWYFVLSDHASGNSWRAKFVQSFDGGSHYQVQGQQRIFEKNNWYHVVIVYDNSSTSNTVIIYVNGSAIGINTDSTPSGTRMDDSSANLVMGDTGQYEFSGNISDVSIFNTILNANTVNSIYNSGVPNNLLLSSSYTSGSGSDSSSNLTNYWRLGSDSQDLEGLDKTLLINKVNNTLGNNIATISTKSANVSASAVVQNSVSSALEAGVIYKISFTISSFVKGGFNITQSSGVDSSTIINGQVGTKNGNHIVYLRSQNTNVFNLVSDSLGYEGSISNFKVEKLNSNSGIMGNMSEFDIIDQAPTRLHGTMTNFDSTNDITSTVP